MAEPQQGNGPLPSSLGSTSMQEQEQQHAAASAGSYPQQQPSSSSVGGPRHTGQCKWFNATKGYGFITSSSSQQAASEQQQEGGEQQQGEDLFVHQVRGRGRDEGKAVQ